MMKKTIKKVIFLMVAMTIILGAVGCASSGMMATTYDQPCAWCNNSPTKKYTTSNNEDCFVCKECSSCCAFCGKEGKMEHYTNLMGIEVFVCDECNDGSMY